MRKSLTLILPALVAVATLSACDPDDQGASNPPPAVAWQSPPTTAGDPDGPAVDRESPDVRSEAPTSSPAASDAGTMSESERERYEAHDGTGDVPYGDDPDNDGRFSDIACDTFDDQGMTCRYGDGTIAARDIDYRDGAWYWGSTPISSDGQCSEEDACAIAWDHATTSPYAVND